MIVIDVHGADALRLYLINSPVVRAESLKFKEEGVLSTVREVLLPWFNAFRFFVQQVSGMGVEWNGAEDGSSVGFCRGCVLRLAWPSLACTTLIFCCEDGFVCFHFDIRNGLALSEKSYSWYI